MKMTSLSIKGVGALVLVYLTYLNNTFSPLLWVLLGLIFVDFLLNIHKEGQQFAKLGSAAVSLGLPTAISHYVGTPEFAKYLVAILCLAYLQVDVPLILPWIQKHVFSKDSLKNKADQDLINAAAQLAIQQIQSQAQNIESSAKQATIGTVETKDTQGGV